VSLIIDALRKNRSIGETDEAGRRAARPAAVLSMGHVRPAARRRPLSLRTVVVYGSAALMLGFVGLSLLIALMAPPAPPRSTADRTEKAVGRGSRAAAPKVDLQKGVGVVGDSGKASFDAKRVPHANPATLPAQQANRVASGPGRADVEKTVARGPARAPLEAKPVTQTSRATPSQADRNRPAGQPDRGAPPPAGRIVAQPSPAPAQPDHFGLALYYQRIGDFNNAVMHYRALLAQNDARAEVHNNLGLLDQDQGQTDEAIAQFQRAIAIDPRYVKAHNNLGVALMRTGQPEAAAAEFRVALAADSRNVESIVNLALVQKSAGRIADARELLQRALTLDPRNAGSHYNLAVVADESGERVSAVEHYRAFLKYGAVTHNDLAERVRARLATLGG